MHPDPHVWPPPPTLPDPELQPQYNLSFGNERLGALSPLCITLGLATAAIFSHFFIAFAFVGAFLVLIGLIFGLLNWRTLGGKIGMAIVVFPLLLFLFAWAASNIH